MITTEQITKQAQQTASNTRFIQLVLETTKKEIPSITAVEWNESKVAICFTLAVEACQAFSELGIPNPYL